MCRLISPPPSRIDRDDESLVKRFFVDHPQQVTLTHLPLRHPAAQSHAADVVRFDNSLDDIRLFHMDAMRSQERQLAASIGSQPDWLRHVQESNIEVLSGSSVTGIPGLPARAPRAGGPAGRQGHET